MDQQHDVVSNNDASGHASPIPSSSSYTLHTDQQVANSPSVTLTSRKIKLTKRSNGPQGSPDTPNVAEVNAVTHHAQDVSFPSASHSLSRPISGDGAMLPSLPASPSPLRHTVSKPRKLQPLPVVLSRMIAALIKKDAYGFFTQPVDEKEVPGYRTLIQQPMDLGTMKEKVEGGRYEMLKQFRADFALVVSNAKVFNPPDSIFHQQALKLESWGLKALDREEEKMASASIPEVESVESEKTTPVPTSSKKLSIRLKRPQSDAQAQPSPSNKRQRASPASKERSVSRPALSSSLRQPPTLAASSPPASDSEDQYRDSRKSSVGDDTFARYSDQQGSLSHTRVKLEEEDSPEEGGEASDEEEDDDEQEDEDNDDEEDSNDQMSHRVGSASLAPSWRESATPVPGGGPRRRPVLPNRRYYPRKNAPLKVEESTLGSVHRVLKEAREANLDMDIHEAALYARQATREQAAEKAIAYCADGSVEVDTMRYVERADLFSSRGFYVDPSSTEPVSGLVLPDVSAVYPLHPDAQQYAVQLSRVAPKDALFVANAVDIGIAEERSSHHASVLPPGYTRFPVTVPTAPVLSTAHEGLLSEGVSKLPNRWPNPQQSHIKDYEVPEDLEAGSLPSARLDPSSLQLKTYGGGPTTQKSRNKDAEREAEGVSNLLDWTYPHTYYRRMWDGLNDLAVWKDAESTLMRFGPNGGIRAKDGELSSFDAWEQTKIRRMKEMIKWEEREAICRAAGSAPLETGVFPPVIDDETDIGMLSKLTAMTDEARTLPNAEKARQHLESLEFCRMILWGSKPDGVRSTTGVNGESWVRSLETFVNGAIEGIREVPDEDMGPIVKAPEPQQHPNGSLRQKEEEEEDYLQDLFRSPSPPSTAQVAATPITPLSNAERTLQAVTLGTILDRPVYDYVRDTVVIPASAQGGLAVAIKAGEWMKGLHEKSKGQREEASDESVQVWLTKDESDEDDLLEKLVDPEDPLWAQVSKILDNEAASMTTSSLLPLSSPDYLANFTSAKLFYLLISTPRLWGRSHFVGKLLNKPMLLDNLLLTKMEEWTASAHGKRSDDAKTSKGAGEDGILLSSDEEIIRFGDSEWTRIRLRDALQQYARLLLWLDVEKGKLRCLDDGEKEKEKGKGKIKEKEEGLKKVQEDVRLALVAIARMAPGYHVQMAVT